MITTTLDIKGMHCRSCEELIEKNIKKISGIKKVQASVKKNNVQISSNKPIDISEIENILKTLGYEIGKHDLSLITKNKEEYKNLLTATFFLIALYIFAKIFELDNIFLPGNTNATLPVVFTVGLTAGVSTCMALIGGLLLAVSARHSEKFPNAKPIHKFRPHIYFNLGRIISFFILGGVIGAVGSIFRLSGPVTGILTILIGFVMLVIGLQLTSIFPKLSNGLTLPKSISKLLVVNRKEEKEYSHKNSFIIGALTFFLPCGFTQAMQLYAVSTGKFTTGALIMGVFAIGTTPGLLAVGGLTSVIKKGFFSNLFFKFIGLLVIDFAAYNLYTGWNLTGFSNGIYFNNDSTEIATKELKVFKSTYTVEKGIDPSKFTVSVNQPTRIEIFAKEDGFGCMGSVMIPGLVNEPKYYLKGETAVLEFTPKRKGNYRITCAMGVPSGILEVK